jgi:Flp pilus assembly protein TadG
MRSHRNRRGRRRGSIALECALTLPFFVLIIFGIIESGQVMMSEEVIVNAAREGARLASLGGSTIGTSSSTGSNEVMNRVRTYLDNAAVPSANAAITVTDLDQSISDLPQASVGDQIKVSVSIPFSKIAWSPSMFFGNAVLSSSSTMRKESP